MSSTLMALKAASNAKDCSEKRDSDLHKASLVLAREYLREHGYRETAEALRKEVGPSLEKLDLADNVDLGSVVREFEAYYSLKLGKAPKLLRRRANDENDLPPPPRHGRKGRPSGSTAAGGSSSAPSSSRNADRPREAGESVALGVIKSRLGIPGGGAQNAAPTKPLWLDEKKGERKDGGDAEKGGGPLDVAGSKLAVRSRSDRNPERSAAQEERLLRPPPAFAGNEELQALAANISREIWRPTDRGETDDWGDVVGLANPKSLLREAVVMPARYPQLFKGITASWGGVLLFGPPGTGKTMLARAVAQQCKTTFFNISASSIVSKYRGDSEKLVRVLFDLARHHSPSTIFIDEIDSIMSQRGAGQGGAEHEGSRRMKTEVLIQMDGLGKSDALVFVLAASNLPWELDMALLRRLEKRVLVPLPDAEGRRAMLDKFLKGRVEAGADLGDYVAGTEGYSGSDLRLLCKEAAMRPVRRLVAQLEKMESSNGGAAIPDDDVEDLLNEHKIAADDIAAALKCTNPSAKLYAEKYAHWHANFGSS